MLSAEELGKLPQAEQVRVVKEQGRYLHFRLQGWCTVRLYWLGSFYVELWYYYDLKQVGLVRILLEKPNLEPYLDNIRLRVD